MRFQNKNRASIAVSIFGILFLFLAWAIGSKTFYIAQEPTKPEIFANYHNPCTCQDSQVISFTEHGKIVLSDWELVEESETNDDTHKSQSQGLSAQIINLFNPFAVNALANYCFGKNDKTSIPLFLLFLNIKIPTLGNL